MPWRILLRKMIQIGLGSKCRPLNTMLMYAQYALS